MIATRGLGICGWYYQDCRVIMETPKWNCFDTAILFSHEILNVLPAKQSTDGGNNIRWFEV